jgi:prepilin-type N-terminal cleavage/methylation domain-containing protein
VKVSERGFTLLEVMVALTITGLALAGLFGVIGGSKRLAWRSETALVHSTQLRSLINYAQLNNERGEVIVDFENPDLRLFDSEVLEHPDRQTQDSVQQLRGYYIVDENNEVVVNGNYWVELEVPE